MACAERVDDLGEVAEEHDDAEVGGQVRLGLLLSGLLPDLLLGLLLGLWGARLRNLLLLSLRGRGALLGLLLFLLPGGGGLLLAGGRFGLFSGGGLWLLFGCLLFSLLLLGRRRVGRCGTGGEQDDDEDQGRRECRP